jgi:hypothetical protein
MKYQIYAYSTKSTERGADHYSSEDTLGRAQKLARYFLSEDFRKSAEMSSRFEYARVVNEKGQCVFDCFG